MGTELLGISIVTYREDPDLLAQTLRHLHAALRRLAHKHSGTVRLTLVDNGDKAAQLREQLDRASFNEARIIASANNLGYGRAHNLALAEAQAPYHLMMKSDVLVAEDALVTAVDYLIAHPHVAALSPHADDGAGHTAFLCKRYPAVLDLVLRGFAPHALRRLFTTRLDRYENRAVVAREQAAEVDLISGCFMFCCTEALKKAGGFDPAYFLYFEDFSLSLELRKHGALMYVPACRIVHYGGNAARKGLRHVLHFTASALKFYNHYGWKLI